MVVCFVFDYKLLIVNHLYDNYVFWGDLISGLGWG